MIFNRFHCAVLAALMVSAAAVTSTSGQSGPASPVELVKRAVANEIKTNATGGKFMFRDRKQTAKGSETRLLVETRQATAGLVIARNDRPLSAEERQAETARAERFLTNPAELDRKEKREREDTEHTLEVMKALPEAFLYTPGGTEAGTQGVGKAEDQLVRLNFRPNPDYVPPSRVEQVLTGMQGYILIDAAQERIAKVDGTLAKDVDFGWGILGRLNRGGHFLVQQGDEGNGQWEITRMDLAFQGKILLFKSLNIQSNEVFGDFRRVPDDLSFEQGLRMLQAQQSDLARNTAGPEQK